MLCLLGTDLTAQCIMSITQLRANNVHVLLILYVYIYDALNAYQPLHQ